MRKRCVLLCSLSAALLLSLTACGVKITAIHLPDEIQVNVGATAETAATYETAQEADPAAQQAAADKIDWTWAVSDNTIATVDGSGVIKGVKGGNTLVTVTSVDGKFTASCPVTVNQPLQGISLSDLDLIINRTDNAEVSCTLTPADTTDTDIAFSIADTSIAKLNGSKVVAVGNGTTTLTATCGKVKATAQITVTTAPTAIQLDNTEGILTVGNTHTITATLLPETTTDTDLLWTTSDDGIATVDEYGTVTALTPGNCIITATTADGQIKATYDLTVKAKPVATPRPTAAPVQTVTEPATPAQPEQPTAPAETPAPQEPEQSTSDIVPGSTEDYDNRYKDFGTWSGIDWTKDPSCASGDDAAIDLYD